MAIGVSANVTKSNLFSQTYANLYNLINNRSNIPDPRGETERKFVYRRIPGTKARGFAGYPFIIVMPASPQIGMLAVSNTKGDVSTDFSIEIRSSDEISGKYAGMGAEWLDTISDNLMLTINSASNKRTMRGYRQARMNIVTDDSDSFDAEGITIFVRRFTISFITRLTVSS